MKKKPTGPMGSRYLATLTLEEDTIIRKAAKALSIPRGVFVRAAAMKMAAECGYYPESSNPNAPHVSVKSAWADAMK